MKSITEAEKVDRNDDYSSWLRNGLNSNGENIEYYEDTHDSRGNYYGDRNRVGDDPRQSGKYISPVTPSREEKPTMQKYISPNGVPDSRPAQPEMPKYSDNPAAKQYKLPDASQYISPRNYQNLVVYEPKTVGDVQNLIDYLRRREPAVVNLDNVGDIEAAQRILDFLSGAIYALNGTMHRIASNIFLLSPEGVEITVPYDVKF